MIDESTINRKIEEYEIKLYGKVSVVANIKRKTLRMPEHLRKYYREQIVKLQKEKLSLPKLKEHRLLVSWRNVIFEDGQVRMILNKQISEPYPYPDSRGSYELLKSYFIRYNLDSLSVLMVDNKVSSIYNIDELHTVIKILSIQNEINIYYTDINNRSVMTILSKLRNISNKELIKILKLKNKNSYFEVLCSLQDINYKIIPSTEVTIINDNFIHEEETFLFTVKGKVDYYIIWESTLINKATYIFQTSANTYIEDIQSLFNYITSIQKYKRKILRNSSRTKKNPFKSIAIVDHKNIETWTSKVKGIL